MVTYRILLDTRRAKSDGTFSVIIRITCNRVSSTINTGVFVRKEFWNDDKSSILPTHENSNLLNKKITEQYLKVQKGVIELEGENTFSFDTLKQRLAEDYVAPLTSRGISFKEYTKLLIDNMLSVNQSGNAIVYQTTSNRFLAYVNNPKVKFIDINYNLLEGFKHHLIKEGMKQNTISNYFRTLRAIYNKAIKAKLVDRSRYPFLDITIKTERTAKRAISIDDLVKIVHHVTIPGKLTTPFRGKLTRHLPGERVQRVL